MPSDTSHDLAEFPEVRILPSGKHGGTVQRLDDGGVGKALFCPSHGQRCRSGCLGFQEVQGKNQQDGSTAILAQCLPYKFSIGRLGPVVPRDLPKAVPDAPADAETAPKADTDTDSPTE